nr:hypothetical protein [Tanacetum cinerariifolium]
VGSNWEKQLLSGSGKSQSNPICKIAVDLLKKTNFTASSTIPSIYIQQFWDTILYDKKAGCYKGQLDEQWFDLTKETLREALQITPVNQNQAFAALPSIDGLIDFVNQLGYPKKHRFHPRPNSPLHLSNEEPVLGYLKFSAKGKKSEVFEIPIPDSLITAEIQQATYYREYLANVTHHRKYLAGEIGGVQNLPAPKPTQPARKPKTTETSNKPPKEKKSKHGSVSKKRSRKNEEALKTEEVPTVEPQVADEDADYQKALEESMKDAYALPKGPLPPVVIREPDSGKYQPLPEVPGKGKAKVTEKQSDNEEESEKVVLGTIEGGQDEGQAGPDSDVQAEDQTGSDVGAQAEGQAGSNPDETSEGQAGPDPGDAEAKVQSISSHVVYAGSDRKHMDLDVADVSPQPSTEQLDEGFTATVYPNVQENLKLVVEESVLLEEPASSSGTLSSLQHLSRDFSFGDQFFSDKHSNANKNAETKVQSMVNITIQQALSSISLMTSPIIDLTSRPESPKEHQQLKATTTDTTTTTTTLPPPQALQQSTTDAMMMKCIGELEHIIADLIQVNKDMEERLDSHESRLHTLEQLDTPQRVSIAPPPHPLPAGPSRVLGAPRASGSAQLLPSPPPPSSTNQENLSKGSAAPNLEMDEDMALDEQAQSSDDEDIGSAHIPTVNLRQGWWKPFEEERPTTSEPACKGRRPALSILKMKAAYYPDAGLEQMVPDQFWIEEECKYDIGVMYGISHWWFQRQRFYIDRHTSEGDRSAVRTHMRILSVDQQAESRFKYEVLTRKDVDRCNAFMFAIQRHLRTRRIFRNLESFVGGRVRGGDYRLLRRTD